MAIERDQLIFLLEMTKSGSSIQEYVEKGLWIPIDKMQLLIEKLQNEGCINLSGGKFEATFETRIKLAVKAVGLGADIERVSQYLSWQEFEEMAALALSFNGYAPKRNVRFKVVKKRWEIDAVGFRKPFVICIDCKHWRHGMHFSTLKRMVLSQINRVEAFSEFAQNSFAGMKCGIWNEAEFVPVILSLIPSTYRFIDDVPIVPILGIQDFISQLPFQLTSLKHFHRKISHL